MISLIVKHLKKLMIACAITLCIFALTVTPSLAHQNRMHSNPDCPRMDCLEIPLDGANKFQSSARRQKKGAVELPSDNASQNIMALKGEVIDVYEMTSPRGNRSGTHLLLKANGETLEIRLGPSWYLEEKDFSIEPEDVIEIEGSQRRQSGKSMFKALKVTKGEQVLRLRDEWGNPLWRQRLQR